MINLLSEIGIVLLLFTLGIEFSITELKALKRPAIIGGSVQVGLCILVTVLTGFLFKIPLTHCLVLGFAMCLSSTAVSIKSFQDLSIPESPPARVTLGIAIFQDMAAILFIVLIPAILDNQGGGNMEILYAIIKGAAFTAAIMLLSRKGFPQMLDAVARTRSRELFTVTIIGLCAAVALTSGLLGLSPALGAFAAGLIISESIYSHRVLSDILPFKDLFLTVFFVSVGLLIDLEVVKANTFKIFALASAIILIKGGIVALSAKLSGLNNGSWLITAAALCSTGEFSIVILNRISDFQLFSTLWEQVLLASTALSMGCVPSLMKWSIKAADKLKCHKSSKQCRLDETLGMASQIEDSTGHVIICGYGPVGKNLHTNLTAAHIPVVVMEMNADTVKSLISQGIKAIFADAKDKEALEVAQIREAHAIAITFPSAEIAIQACHHAIEVNPDIIVYARSKFITDTYKLKKAGIHHVLHDEEQSGRAMTRSVMKSFTVDIAENWEIEEI